MSNGDARLDNRLAFFDQATFLSSRATGRSQLMQIVWIYEHPVDFDALKRFHSSMEHGLVGRLIERSPLPFGRHRWVSPDGPSDMDIADRPRPRPELRDWADERAGLPIDPEWGPGWHIAAQPLTDGSTAISGVVSHCLADGIGGMVAIIDAAMGNMRDFGYPPARSRTRLRALVADARETWQGAPEAARALAALAKVLFRHRHDNAQPAASRPTAIIGDDADRDIVVPTVTIYADLDEWDARAKALGGNSYSLFAGLAAKLGERMGRRRADGTVDLLIPISDRTPDDTRANAMSHAKVSVDPTPVTTDLSGVRVMLRQALKTAREAPNEATQFFPLAPFIPKRAMQRMVDVLFGFADFPVICSNLGDLPVEIGRPDGTDAEYVMLRAVDQNVTRRYMESIGGQLVVVGGRVVGKMSISVAAYQPGGINSKSHLRELVANTLAEFDLTGVID